MTAINFIGYTFYVWHTFTYESYWIMGRKCDISLHECLMPPKAGGGGVWQLPTGSSEGRLSGDCPQMAAVVSMAMVGSCCHRGWWERGGKQHLPTDTISSGSGGQSLGGCRCMCSSVHPLCIANVSLSDWHYTIKLDRFVFVFFNHQL